MQTWCLHAHRHFSAPQRDPNTQTSVALLRSSASAKYQQFKASLLYHPHSAPNVEPFHMKLT